jgi:hypothetical protein
MTRLGEFKQNWSRNAETKFIAEGNFYGH